MSLRGLYGALQQALPPRTSMFISCAYDWTLCPPCLTRCAIDVQTIRHPTTLTNEIHQGMCKHSIGQLPRTNHAELLSMPGNRSLAFCPRLWKAHNDGGDVPTRRRTARSKHRTRCTNNYITSNLGMRMCAIDDACCDRRCGSVKPFG